MEKEKMIQEMACKIERIFIKESQKEENKMYPWQELPVFHSICLRIATSIFPDGAVVLTREELEQRNKEIKELKIANNNLIFQLQCHDDEVQRLMKENGKLRFERDFAQKIVSKKTAKEILDEVSKHYGGGWLVELYKKYGVGDEE